MNNKHTDWYKDAVIYQIYPRSFCDSNNDGLGDINGIISKLDYLKSLGVNCVWLSPIYDSPQEDNGYDISNYYDIYKPFGTLEDAKRMFSEMHNRNIRVIMDLVVNHTSSEHAWFKSAISDKNSPYRDYYIVKKGKKNGKKPPNNWQGFFGGSAWERIGDSEEYYLHLFTKGQPDLNWENPKLREEIKKILRFWLDLGVDGFRCDVITLISKKQDFKSRFPAIALTGKDAFINGPRLHEYLHELYEDVYSHYDSMTVGETVLSNLNQAKLLVDPKREELDMIFNFDHTDSDNFLGVKYFYRKFKLNRFKKRLLHWQNGLKGCGWNSLFIENHDQRRSVGRFGTTEGKYSLESSKSLALAYFMLQGTPFIYQGQEIGMRNAHFKNIDEIQDVESHNMYKLFGKFGPLKKKLRKILFDVSRDNARTPMCWDDSEYAGFSKVKPWLKVNAEKDQINVENALKDENSLFYFYKKMIEFRNGNEIIKNGDLTVKYKRNSKLFVYERVLNDKKITVVCSFSNKPIKCRYLREIKGELVLSNYQENRPISLFPFECRLYNMES